MAEQERKCPQPPAWCRKSVFMFSERTFMTSSIECIYGKILALVSSPQMCSSVRNLVPISFAETSVEVGVGVVKPVLTLIAQSGNSLSP